jgi:hypothetical protein
MNTETVLDWTFVVALAIVLLGLAARFAVWLFWR